MQFLCSLSILNNFSKVRVISDETVLLCALTRLMDVGMMSPPPIPILRTSLQHLLSFIHNIILEGNETNKSIIVWFWGSGPNRSF